MKRLIAVALTLFLTACGTSVVYQSSDGVWVDGENQFKGRDFRTVVVFFELYKMKCNASEASLERVTRKPAQLSFETLFNDYSEPKWKVALSPNISLNEPRVSPKCVGPGVGYFVAEIELAEERADEYINSLRTYPSSSAQEP